VTIISIELSPAAYAIAKTVAAGRSITPHAYVESLIMADGLPAIVAQLGGVGNHVIRAPRQKKLSPKRRKADQRKAKAWQCPCCSKLGAPRKFSLTGGRLHFLACGMRHGVEVEDLAAYAVEDAAMGGALHVFEKPIEEAVKILNELIDQYPTWRVLRDETPARKKLRRHADHL